MKALFTLFILLSLLLHAEPINSDDGVVSWRYYSQDGISIPSKTLRSNPTERLNGLNYLNTLRTGAGLIAYSANSQLDTAAYNHAYYLTLNNLFGHYENQSQYPTGFTGVYPWDRGYHTGYTTYCSYGENLSAGDADIYEAIDGLMTAIYHRFGFLDFKNDEVGIGSSFDGSYAYGSAYNFNMASQSGCSTNETTNPHYVLWPHNNYKNAQTSFGNTESPDPVPECSGINGNPISIEFNSAKNGTISMTSFKLYENDGSEITNTKTLTEATDPNNLDSDPNTHGVNSNQFILFPMQSLDLDSRYKAEFKYTEDSTPKTITWYFNTRRYDMKRYVATTGNTYDVISGETYLFHLKFADCNTTVNGWGGNATINRIDSDIFQITTSSNTVVTFYHVYKDENDATIWDPVHTLNLNIAPTDNAIEPSPLSNPTLVPIIHYLLF
jgi:uncharacterized protein YkwD